MMFMNEYEIQDAMLRYRTYETPNLARAASTLHMLADWANRNSDGWAYWPKPVRAARRLQELIQSVDRWEPEDVSADELKRALTPIKSFLTRQGVDHSVVGL